MQRLGVRGAWAVRGSYWQKDLSVQRENRPLASGYYSTREGENSVSYLKYHSEMRSLNQTQDKNIFTETDISFAKILSIEKYMYTQVNQNAWKGHKEGDYEQEV